MSVGAFNDATEYSDRVISMWAGLLSDIPSGWVLCDGNNGTPDLRDKFVRNVNSMTDSPGTAAGTHSYTLAKGQLPSHDHTGSANAAGGHDHTGNTSSYGYEDYNTIDPHDFAGPSTTIDGDTYTRGTTNSVGDHRHSYSVSTTGSDNSIDNRPAYYEVAFIMKV